MQLEYQVHKKIAIFGGPAFRYMMTNMAKEDRFGIPVEPQQRSQALSLDLGLSLKL